MLRTSRVFSIDSARNFPDVFAYMKTPRPHSFVGPYVITFICGCLLSSLPQQVNAGNLLQGNREFGTSGLVDFDTIDGTLIDLSILYGWVIMNGVELGAQTSFRDNDSLTQWRFGAFAEYNFFTSLTIVPFVGLLADLVDTDIVQGPENTAVSVGVTGGIKYFLTESVALTTALSFDTSAEEIFISESGAEKTNWDLALGMRFYF